MAVFNPETDIVDADWTAASRGQIANRSFEKLFEGASDTLLGAVDVLDLSVKERASNSMQRSVDALDQEWTGGASAFETEINSKNIQPAPGDLQRYLEHLNLNKEAYQAGTLKESAYSLRVDSIARQMRARFPGHREFIDTELSRILGRSTANKARQDLMQEWATEKQGVDDEYKFRRQFVKENMAFISPGLMEKWVAGDQSVWSEIQLEVAGGQREVAQVTHENSRLERDSKLQTLSRQDVTAAANEQVGRAVNSMNGKIYAGVNFDEMDKAINSGQPIPPEKIETYTQALNQMEERAISDLQQMWVKPWTDEPGSGSFAGKLGYGDEYNNAKAAITQRVASLKDALVTGKTSLLGANARIYQAISDQSINQALLGPNKEYWRLVDTAKRLGADMQLTYYMQTPGNDLLEKQQKAFKDLFGAVALGDETVGSVDEALSTVNEATGGKVKPKTAEVSIKGLIDSMFAPDATPEGKLVAARKLFGKENLGMLQNQFRNVKSQEIIFGHMTSKRVTDEMRKLGQQDPQIWSAYQGWVVGQFRTLFKGDADTIMDGHVYGDSLEIKIGPDNLIHAYPAKGAESNMVKMNLGFMIDKPTQIQAAWDWFVSSGMQDSINRFNKYSSVVRDIVEDDEGKYRAMAILMQNMGIDASKEKQGSLLGRMYKAIISGVSESADITTEMKKTEPGKDTPTSDEDLDVLELGEVLQTQP